MRQRVLVVQSTEYCSGTHRSAILAIVPATNCAVPNGAPSSTITQLPGRKSQFSSSQLKGNRQAETVLLRRLYGLSTQPSDSRLNAERARFATPINRNSSRGRRLSFARGNNSECATVPTDRSALQV